MLVVVEIDADGMSDDHVRRLLKDANRQQEADDTQPFLDRHHWIDLETPLMCLNVTRFVGVVDRGTEAFAARAEQMTVVPL